MDEQTSPLLSSEWLKLDCVRNGTHFFPVHPDPNWEDGLTFDFFRSPLSSEKVEFDLVVDGKHPCWTICNLLANLIPSHADIRKYPHHHSYEISLRSPPPHLDEDKDLLKCLMAFNPKSQSIKETLKSVASHLALHTRYSTDFFEVPDDKTMLIAVLGSSDLTSDDWLGSDFCLFHKALGGTAKQETWLTCASLLDVVKAHGPIIHGSPYHKPWCIVFDDTSKDFTTPVTPISIANSFLTSLQTAAEHTVTGDRIPHHSVPIHVRYIDNRLTLYRLRHPSGRPPDCT